MAIYKTDAVVAVFADQVRAAAAEGATLRIRGGGSKDFYGGPLAPHVLDTRPWSGILAYEPTELYVSARCGTPLSELKLALAEKGQMLACEPPHFGRGATVGGMVAAGLSGPRRAYAGSVRDFVLGATLLDARCEVMRFGGTVIKNVAGYDLSRVLAGSMGVLGLVLDVSLKVVPRPVEEATLAFDMDEARALEAVNRWAGQPLPLSASAWTGGRLMLRLSGASAALRAARATLGGEAIAPPEAEAFWVAVREHRHPFFAGSTPLWRLSLPSTARPMLLPGMRSESQLVEWGGALRWWRADEPADAVQSVAAMAGGHATLFRGGDRSAGAFHPLSPALALIHRRLKQQFDPGGVFDPGRLYADMRSELRTETQSAQDA
jgi:glycolate oxidase FAD binding subunit